MWAVAAAVAISAYYWILPYYAFETQTISALLSIIVFAVFGILIATTVGLTRNLLKEHVDHAEERMRVARETVHRTKNLLSVVQAISRKVARRASSLADYNERFSQRLSALGTAQDVLIRTTWEDVLLDHVIESALAPFLPNPALVVRPGPKVTVPAAFVSGVSLALYELATNAMKYGCLLPRPGSVTITWRVSDDVVSLDWLEVAINAEESGETTAGFGSFLIQHALNNATGTDVRYDVTDTGVHATFKWPCNPAQRYEDQ
jgi:two-component sensor histidine kinase